METVISSEFFVFDNQQIGEFGGLCFRMGCMQDTDVLFLIPSVCCNLIDVLI